MPITVIDKIKQKNNQSFKLLDASDINWDISLPEDSIPDNIYTKEEADAAIATAIANAGHLTREIVESLPETGKENIIYMIPNSSNENQNIYDEYMYINNKFEKLGTSEVDLSGYVTSSNLNSILDGYATIASLDNYITKSVADATYLTQGDLSGYATTTQLSQNLTEAKSYADTQDSITLQSAQAYTDSKVASSINPNTLTVDDITESDINGAIHIKNKDVNIHGLGTAAYKNVEDFVSSNELVWQSIQ